MISIDFSGKNVLLTGAGGGIGQGIARQYGKTGAKLHLADMKPEAMDGLVKELKADGVDVVAHALNVTDEAAVAAVVDGIVANDGKLDMLCNCAGIIVNKPYMETTSDDFDRILAVNLVGMHKVIQASLKHMLPAGAGKIVNIASASTRKGNTFQIAYSASKFGVQSLTQSVALSVAEKGINVNAICPGFVQSAMYRPTLEVLAKMRGTDVDTMQKVMHSLVPFKRDQTPEDIGNAAVFLCSDLAVNITGQALNVDGGMNMN